MSRERSSQPKLSVIVWSIVAVGAPLVFHFAVPDYDMAFVSWLPSFMIVVVIARTAIWPNPRYFWPGRTHQAVSGQGVGLLTAAVLVLLVGWLENSDATLFLAGFLCGFGAMMMACALILKSKEDELHASEPAAQPG